MIHGFKYEGTTLTLEGIDAKRAGEIIAQELGVTQRTPNVAIAVQARATEPTPAPASSKPAEPPPAPPRPVEAPAPKAEPTAAEAAAEAPRARRARRAADAEASAQAEPLPSLATTGADPVETEERKAIQAEGKPGGDAGWNLSGKGTQEGEDDAPAPRRARKSDGAFDLGWIKEQTKFNAIVKHLIERGFDTEDKLLAVCNDIKADVPVISRIASLAERIPRTLEAVKSAEG